MFSPAGEGGIGKRPASFFVFALFCWRRRRPRKRLLQTHDADVPTLLHTAQDALGKNDFTAAADALKQVVAAQPTLTAAWFNLGYAYTGLHQQEEAVAAYRKAVELDPNLFEARLNLGILLMQMNNPQAALEHLEKAATLKPDHVRAQLYYGQGAGLDRPRGARRKTVPDGAAA